MNDSNDSGEMIDARPPAAADEIPYQPQRRITPMEGADLFMLYLMRRRESLIIELREIDRVLGRPPTVPLRER